MPGNRGGIPNKHPRRRYQRVGPRVRTQPTPGRPRLTPDGMCKAEADILWAAARQKADWIMDELKEAGVIPAAVNPVDPNSATEEQMGNYALRYALAYIMSPMGDEKLRATHVRTVLEWTKAKPATKTDLRLNNAEAWLAEVVADHKAADAEGRS